LGQDEIEKLLSLVYKAIVVRQDLKQSELKTYLPTLDDKKDVHVLAAYEKFKCDILVTGDKELLKKAPGAKTTRQTLTMLLSET